MNNFDWVNVATTLILFLMFAPAIVQTIDFSFGSPYNVHVSDTPIKSLNDGSKISGRFALGSGSIRESPQFVYYAVDGPGYRLRTVPAGDTLVIEDTETDPYISTFEVRKEGCIFHGYYPAGNTYVFHVPKGTITVDYTLDSELR